MVFQSKQYLLTPWREPHHSADFPPLQESEALSHLVALGSPFDACSCSFPPSLSNRLPGQISFEMSCTGRPSSLPCAQAYHPGQSRVRMHELHHAHRAVHVLYVLFKLTVSLDLKVPIVAVVWLIWSHHP
jgi:hypothetical protein